MKNKQINKFISRLCAVLLICAALISNSCKRGFEIKNESQLAVNQTILDAKALVDSLVLQQGANSFIKTLGFETNWKKAIIDSAGNIRVPLSYDLSKLKPKDGKQIPNHATKNIFELYIKKNRGETEVSIMQFMNFKEKYYTLRYSLAGEGKSKINLSEKNIVVLSKKSNGKKALFIDKNKTMIYLKDALELFRQELGQNFSIAYIFECPGGNYFDTITCLCDWPTNAVNNSQYPELYMMVAYTSPSYQVVPYPFPFHPSEIEPDPEYPNEPINSSTINNTPSCDVTATLDAISATVTPGETVDLTATISISNGVVITEKSFEVNYKSVWYGVSSAFEPITQDSICSLQDAEINVPGSLKYRLKIIYTCNGAAGAIAYSNEVSTYSQYTSAQFMTQFATQMNDAWAQTKTSSIANPGTKYEYGFNVYYNPANKQIELDGTIVSANVSCNTDTLFLGLPVDRPLGGYTLGGFHTHPPLTYCSNNRSIVPGPSTFDISRTKPYPQIVRTYTNTVSGGHNINLAITDHVTNSKTVTDY